MSCFKCRDCGFSELGSRAICLAYLRSRHAIEGQSSSPTGDVSVSKTEQPRLGSAARARPSTVKGTRSVPKCDGVTARLSPARNQMYQQISIMYQKCKEFYVGRTVCRGIRHPTDGVEILRAQRRRYIGSKRSPEVCSRRHRETNLAEFRRLGVGTTPGLCRRGYAEEIRVLVVILPTTLITPLLCTVGREALTPPP